MRKTKSFLEKACLLCGGDHAEPLLIHKGRSFVRCRHCGLIYQDPPPSAEESREFYEKGYYEGFRDQIASIHEARAPLYRRFLSECTSYRRSGRILDMGCGFGDFLKMAEEKGWEAWGIEPSWVASEIARKALGSQILNETIEFVELPENHFDIVTLWNVIDCLPDPVAALQKVRRWLSPGGVLFIRTPNSFFHLMIHRLYSFLGPFLKKIGWEKEASVFLRANFDATTLQRLLHRAGFSAVQIRNGEPTEGDAYQVSSRLILTLFVKRFVYWVSCWFGFISGNRLLIGSNLIAQASKGDVFYSKFQPVAMQLRIRLKSVVLHILALVGYLVGLRLWFKIFGKDREIRILLYHSINEFRKNDVNVRESQFRKQLDFLSMNYSVISLEEAVTVLKNQERTPKPPVVLTFDDGYEDNYRVAFPLLKGKGFPATIFLLTGDESGDRRLPHLVDDQPQYNQLLSWDQVRQMAASGIGFGSHGETHSVLTRLNPDEARREIFASKERIESETGQAIQFFSYPYGMDCDFDRDTEEWVHEAGYQAAFSAIFGTNGKGADPYALRRIGIEASDSQFSFRAKLNGALGLLSLFDFPPIRRMIRWVDSVFLGRAPSTSLKRDPLLLVSVDFPPHADGVSTISRELSVRIAKRGAPVFVIGPKDKGDRGFDCAQSYRSFRVSGYSWGYLRFVPVVFRMPWVVWRFGIRKVLAMNMAYGGIVSWLLSFFSRLEYLIFAYGYEFEKVRKIPFVRLLYRSIYRRAKGIVACSQFVKERLILFGVDRAKIKVLYPAVDFERYRPLEVPREYLEKKRLRGRRLILTVGRIIERKGHDRVLQALPRILDAFPNVLYGIVGIGDQERRLREEVKRLHLRDHVQFFGKVSEEELIWLYNACEFLVMPSREISEGGHLEGFGIVFLEANACGRPVIGGRSGGVVEAIREGETGFLVDPNRPEEIAEKVIFLLSHPEKAEAFGREGLRWVKEGFNWERYVERAFEFLYGSPLP